MSASSPATSSSQSWITNLSGGALGALAGALSASAAVAAAALFLHHRHHHRHCHRHCPHSECQHSDICRAKVSDLSSSTINADNPMRVLSIQSTVVFGYVGNKCSLFPLQLFGFDADPIHSVQFSNHTGYKKWSGSKATGHDFSTLLEGLEINGFLPKYSHLLLGYMGSTSFFERVVTFVESIKASSPQLSIVCDPVLGDNGKFYVPSDFLPLYQRLIPLADLVTPNQTEIEFLTGRKICSVQQAAEAAQQLHQQGVKMVVITSMKVEEEEKEEEKQGAKKIIHLVASAITAKQRKALLASKSSANTESVGNLSSSSSSLPSSSSSSSSSSLVPCCYLHIRLPQLGGYFVGTGDLCAALLLAWCENLGLFGSAYELLEENELQQKFKTVVENSVSTVQSVIRRTVESNSAELKLVQSRANILNPSKLDEWPDISVEVKQIQK